MLVHIQCMCVQTHVFIYTFSYINYILVLFCNQWFIIYILMLIVGAGYLTTVFLTMMGNQNINLWNNIKPHSQLYTVLLLDIKLGAYMHIPITLAEICFLAVRLNKCSTFAVLNNPQYCSLCPHCCRCL